jgi:hypothetical protein
MMPRFHSSSFGLSGGTIVEEASINRDGNHAKRPFEIRAAIYGRAVTLFRNILVGDF